MKTVNADTLKKWVRNNEAVLVDVREPAEYQMGHIAGATLLPLGMVSVKALPEFGDKKLVMYCVVGARSASACMKLLAEDPELEVYNLAGGIDVWKRSGF